MTDHHGYPSTGSTTVIIIPTYNERTNLASLVPALLGSSRFDILVVDDNSPDGTADLVAEMAKIYDGRLFLIRRPAKLGLGTAYLAGFDWSLERNYDLVCEMDADFSHDPLQLPLLVDAARYADLVLGSRYVPGGGTANWSRIRQAISKCGSQYARLILGLPYRDLTGGFKCFRRQVLAALDLDAVHSTGYAFQIELTFRAHQAGFRIAEVPIRFDERRAGQSKMSTRIMLEALIRVWQLRLASRHGSVSPRLQSANRRHPECGGERHHRTGGFPAIRVGPVAPHRLPAATPPVMVNPLEANHVTRTPRSRFPIDDGCTPGIATD